MKKVCLGFGGVSLLLLLMGLLVYPIGRVWASNPVDSRQIVHNERHLAMSITTVTEERQKLYAEYFDKLKLKRDLLAAEGKPVQELDRKLELAEAVFAESQLAISQQLQLVMDEYNANTISTASLRGAIRELQLVFSSMYSAVESVFQEIERIS